MNKRTTNLVGIINRVDDLDLFVFQITEELTSSDPLENITPAPADA